MIDSNASSTHHTVGVCIDVVHMSKNGRLVGNAEVDCPKMQMEVWGGKGGTIPRGVVADFKPTDDSEQLAGILEHIPINRNANNNYNISCFTIISPFLKLLLFIYFGCP